MFPEPTGLDALTEHQKQLLRLYIQEGSYKGVAHRMDRSFQHVRNNALIILRKLDVSCITQAVVMLDRSER